MACNNLIHSSSTPENGGRTSGCNSIHRAAHHSDHIRFDRLGGSHPCSVPHLKANKSQIMIQQAVSNKNLIYEIRHVNTLDFQKLSTPNRKLQPDHGRDGFFRGGVGGTVPLGPPPVFKTAWY
ncbi:uncharacterized protein LOC125570131 [Nematostella vectensis]|uniref:uncharacterized protein LOC125570131 n=1 Tax=Nematostella vectensis TaxID=45351 RepID=UPI0020771A9D|nr:uncharacterized protein LOC125570131 [Nematostella vectensis]